MNRRNFLRNIVYVASTAAAVVAMNPPTVFDLARKEQDENWMFGNTRVGNSIWDVESKMDGSLHRLTVQDCRRIHQCLIAHNVQPHMAVKFAYNLKTKEFKLGERIA